MYNVSHRKLSLSSRGVETNLRRFGIGDDVRVRHAENARENEADLVLGEGLSTGVVQDRGDHARRGQA